MPIGCSSFGTTSNWARVRSGLISVKTRPNSLSNGASGNGCTPLCLHGPRGRSCFRGTRSGTRWLPILWSAGTAIFAVPERGVDDMVTATTDPVRLPPGPRTPKPIQALRFLVSTHSMYGALARRYGSTVISVNLPGLGHAVAITDPVLAKEVLNASTDLLERKGSGTGSLGDGFGPGSTFSLDGARLLARRKVVLPLFHGKRMRSYEHIIEDEGMREIATWPEGREFKTLPSMTSITLGAILRAV